MEPERKLLEISTLINNDSFLIFPRDPYRPLPDKWRVCSLGIVKIQSGILPSKVVAVKVPRKPGTLTSQLAPEVSLSSTNTCKIVAEQISSGKEPPMQLLCRITVCICLLKSTGGMVPESAFCDKSRVTPTLNNFSDTKCLDPRLAKSEGIGPTIKLLLMLT